MNYETKRNVFETIADKCAGYDDELYKQYLNQYDAALLDNLPVIPKAVSEWIKKCKHRNVTLADTLCMEMRPENVRNWMAFKDGDVANDFDRAGYLRKQDLMASAWVLGVWCVEENGEIVKL